MIVSKTPLRMSFAGGGSDISSYYRKEEGAVISTSIDKYMYVTVNKKFDGDIRLSYSITEDVSKASQLKHPIVRHTLKLLNISGGIEIASMADIPSKGSGLGSSSSYTVALLHALYAYQGNYIAKAELGRLASHVEIGLCGEPIGKQDQYAAAFGGLNLIKFHADDSVSVDPVICKPAVLAADLTDRGEQLLCAFCGFYGIFGCIERAIVNFVKFDCKLMSGRIRVCPPAVYSILFCPGHGF